jgi:hypothetical protein
VSGGRGVLGVAVSVALCCGVGWLLVAAGEVAYMSMCPACTARIEARPSAPHPRAQPAPNDGPDARAPDSPLTDLWPARPT